MSDGLVKVAIFKRRRFWRVECTASGCIELCKRLRFANHAMACWWAAGHIADHNYLQHAALRSHAVTRMGRPS